MLMYTAAELILNNFSTLLGNSVGRLFGSLFPPLPQFRGRQVVTLHNQRDFLFFRRHRYMFSSATSAKLQEIGPRFTLKLRWLRKGLPAVTAQDGRVPGGAGKDHDDDDEEPMDDEDESMEEQAAMGEIGKKSAQPAKSTRDKEAEMGIPALDEEQEYEWKWKVCLATNFNIGIELTASAKDGGVPADILLVSAVGLVCISPYVAILFTTRVLGPCVIWPERYCSCSHPVHLVLADPAQRRRGEVP